MFDLSPLAALTLAVFPIMVMIAALKDLSSYTIPNWISVALLAGFAPAALAAGLSWEEVALHAAVGGVALLVGIGMFALKWIGGGDAKLFSAAALWLGLAALPVFLVWTAVAGGGLTLGLLAARKIYALSPFLARPAWIKSLLAPKGDVPYGVALAAGALLAFPQSGLLLAGV